MDEDAVSVSSTSTFRLRWDVFLSFRGEDTRNTFTNTLYKSLEERGVRVFLDDEGMRGGDEIKPCLLEAIEDSAASIAIISPNYASSHWCLEELSKICEYRRLLLPVFYRVNPSDVRRQRGTFEEHFRNHEKTYGEDKVRCWRRAMEKAGAIVGWPFEKSEIDAEAKERLIESLVKRVLTELANTPVGLATYTVGLGSRLEKLMSVLDVKSNGVRVLGLYGTGGVGKTTLAKALCNKIVGRFDCLSFISKVRENSAKDADLVSLQNKLIHDLSSGKSPVYSIAAIKEVLQEKRVLVVLDDVGNVSQLEALIGRREWFSEGSRIIITTRDTQVLPEHIVTAFYEVRELDSSDALKLFSYHALRREKPIDGFFSLSKEIVSFAGGLPLALEVFGSYLVDKRRKEEWEDALQKLKRIRPSHLQDVLKISFDGLDAEEKRIFLDISCLLIKMEMKREDAIDVLKGCGFRAEIAVRVFITRSLIKITEENTLWMHDQVREMGRQIVLDANPLYPNIPSRLWDRDEIMTVLKAGKGTGCIEGIVLDFKMRPFVKDPSGDRISWENFKRSPNFTSALTYLEERHKKCLETKAEREREVILYTKSFESMSNLRLLQINYTRLVGRYMYIPAQLKWLQWKGCPLKSLPKDFCPRELAVLDLSESKIEQVWRRFTNQVAEKLMVMNLRGCHNLVATPDFSGHKKLEKLDLEHCHSLIKIHESIGNVSTLLHLNLSSCWNLVEFPAEVSGLKNLENLILSGCSKLKKLPMDIGDMRSLKELLVDNTAIQELPESIFHLTKLEKLKLNGCRFVTKLPNCIGKLSSLKELSLNNTAVEEIPDSVGSLLNLEILSLIWCESLTSIPDSVGNLISLAKFLIHGSAIKELPASIGSLQYLKDLSAGSCPSLSKLPDSIEGLASVVELQLDQTPITNLPDQVGALKMLRKLEMRNCKGLKSLPESIGCMFALTSLNISESSISELPESIGKLENLTMFRLNKCTQLRKLPDSIGNLKSLHHLLMEETAVTELPKSFGMLSSLMILKMAKKPHFLSAGNRVPKEDLGAAEQEKHNPFTLPTSFSNLCSLEELDARAWNLCGKIPDDFERLSSLEILNLSHNNFVSLPSSLRGLPFLKTLFLHYCEQLKSLPPLPSSLVEVNVANCTALERVSDISKLESLRELNLANCEKVEDIPGLECLKSLTRLFMSGCKACSSVVKRRLSKVFLRNFRSLSMPGNKIPAWFSQEVRFSERKNHDIKGVIIGVVVSLNPQIPDDLRDQLPALPCVGAKIVKLNEVLFSTMPELKGVPKTNEDHIYLFRYPDCHPLVSKLRDSYDIKVREQDPPFIKGIEVKKFGLYLIFDGDDDYEGDEELLDKSELSVSEKLAKFFSSPEDEDHTSESGIEVESQIIMQEIEEEEVWGGFLRLVRGCFCF
ncbi:disease resistance protein RPV1-like [Juglans microcarpa x Juglans regia]|uniref:disease resistance protein RPV1-like n=1 Tax=Juglans microcarpa x Juglans regia TaxID=2249226 RepID=UPI001B7F6C19|nr:disease resistance protein RPV1-like [Juglans microcarpa x Juglans regia]